jgi:hypothetical protein
MTREGRFIFLDHPRGASRQGAEAAQLLAKFSGVEDASCRVRCFEVVEHWKKAIQGPGLERSALPPELQKMSRAVEFLRMKREGAGKPKVWWQPTAPRIRTLAVTRLRREFLTAKIEDWKLPHYLVATEAAVIWFRTVHRRGLTGLYYNEERVVVVNAGRAYTDGSVPVYVVSMKRGETLKGQMLVAVKNPVPVGARTAFEQGEWILSEQRIWEVTDGE